MNRIAFIHGRPGPHPAHGAYAKAVEADFYPVDPLLRWHDRPRPRYYRYASWLVCSAQFAFTRSYDVILSEGPHVTPLLIRGLRFSKDIKTICFLGSEMLFFLANHRYSPIVSSGIIRVLNAYDGVICSGEMQASIAVNQLKLRPRVHVHFNGVPASREEELRGCTPDLTNTELVLVANGPGGWRTWYKGVDLVAEVVARCRRERQDVHLTVVGEWDRDIRAQYGSSALDFAGQSQCLSDHFRKGCIYLHCARGDAFPHSVLEAMAAGLIPVVSEWTGTKEAVQRIDPTLVCPLDAERISARVLAILALSPNDKQVLSDRAREVAREYSQARAIDSFKRAFQDCLDAM